MTSRPARFDWLLAVRRYLAVVAVGNLAWEFMQIPLYTLWRTGSPGQIIFAVLHCTAGDVVIATSALVGALAVFGSPDWPRRHSRRVGGAVIAIGFGYTVYSEYLNAVVRQVWAYSDLMPTLPWLGIGLAPMAQWLVVPTLSLVWARRIQPQHPTSYDADSGTGHGHGTANLPGRRPV